MVIHTKHAAKYGFVTTKSFLPVEPRAIWDWCTTPQGINNELAPIMKMTVPKALRGRGISDLPIGVTIGRSWFLLFGLVPIDFDDLGLAEVEVGRFFRETSVMSSIENWEHRRELVPSGSGTLVVDAVKFKLGAVRARIPGLYSSLGLLLAFLFRHRHRRLALYFGVPPMAVGQVGGICRIGDPGSESFDPDGNAGEPAERLIRPRWAAPVRS